MTGEPDYDYQVTELVGVVDGDTFDLRLSRTVDFGFYLQQTCSWVTRFRLLGVDAVERSDARGSEATAFSGLWVKRAIDGPGLRGRTHKADHFGRWLIDLYRVDDGQRLADQLLATGLAVPYSG
jgi:endonuclease YncB( thermonuclease family)